MKAIKRYLTTVGTFLQSRPDEYIKNIQCIIELIANADRILICGNGGSAATAMHMATDFEKNLNLKAYSLVSNIALMTAYSNDFEYDDIFALQLYKFDLTNQDLVIAISGSGNSQNVINAINYANTLGAKTLSFTGYDGGMLRQISNYNINVPLDNMQMIEDIHSMLNHIIVYSLMEE